MDPDEITLEDAARLFRNLDEHRDDVWLLRDAQDVWDARDPAAAREFFQQQYESQPGDPLRMYLHGRLHKSDPATIELARSIIDTAPDWSFGYRLMMNIYSNCLFRQECPREDQRRFSEQLKSDAHFFEQVFDETPESGQLLGYVFEYHLCMHQTDRAAEVIKKARKLDQEWALDHDAMLFVRANRGDHKALRKQVTSMVKEKIRQGFFPKKDRDKLINDYLVHYYRFGFGYRGGLEMLEEWLPKVTGDRERADVFFDMARFKTLLERDDEAFDLLNRAADLGFDNLERAERHNCLEMLHPDPRWSEVVERFRQNWLADLDRRKSEALENKLDMPAPDWELPDENGEMVRLSDLQGKVVILEFWATYCRPCRKGMPEISEFTRVDAGPNVKVLSINIRNENRRYAKAFKDKRGYKTKILFGDDNLGREYGIQSIAVLMVVDPRGHIRFREDGFHFGIRDRLNWWTDDLMEEFGMERQRG
jgi:thiol-disulfide isomerase/thioredoxin